LGTQPGKLFISYYFPQSIPVGPQRKAKSNAFPSDPLTYSCYVICARPSYGGGVCIWDGGVY